jgi:hypothetical protein
VPYRQTIRLFLQQHVKNVIHRPVLARIASYDPRAPTRFLTPAERAEFERLRQRVDGDYRITTGQLFNGPRAQPQSQLNRAVEAVGGEQEEAVGGEEEGAVGGGITEDEEALQSAVGGSYNCRTSTGSNPISTSSGRTTKARKKQRKRQPAAERKIQLENRMD